MARKTTVFKTIFIALGPGYNYLLLISNSGESIGLAGPEARTMFLAGFTGK
jgi:hypothetical protein